MVSLFMSMVMFALVGAASPGPVNLLATSSGAAFGFWRTLPFVLGATVSYSAMVLLVGLGLSEVLQNTPNILPWVSGLGALFLLWMAYKLATSPVGKTDATQQVTVPPSFIAGGLLQCLNPKAWLVSMSGVSVFVLAQSDDRLLWVFGGVSFLMCLTGVALWALLGQVLGRLLSGKPEYLGYFNRGMALLLAVSVVTLFM